jgi:hypothetical protein
VISLLLSHALCLIAGAIVALTIYHQKRTLAAILEPTAIPEPTTTLENDPYRQLYVTGPAVDAVSVDPAYEKIEIGAERTERVLVKPGFYRLLDDTKTALHVKRETDLILVRQFKFGYPGIMEDPRWVVLGYRLPDDAPNDSPTSELPASSP